MWKDYPTQDQPKRARRPTRPALPTPPQPPQKENDRDYYRVLSDVMEDQKARESRRESASAVQRANRSNSNTMATVAMVCGALSVYVWTNPPEFIQPAPFAEQSAEVDNAALAFAIQIGVNAVNNFREANGRLPTSLDELEIPSAFAGSIGYARLGQDLFRVEAYDRDKGDTVTYRSDTNLSEIVGGARERLLGTAGRNR